MNELDVRLESAGALLTATGMAAPSEVLQLVSAMAGICVCGIAIVKALIQVVQIVRNLFKRKITTEQALDQLEDVQADLEEVGDDDKV